MECLGFIQGSCCPHYDSENQRRPGYQRLVGDGSARPGYALDDGVALHFTDDKLNEIVTSRPDAHAYQLQCTAGTASEHLFPSRYLGVA